MEYRNLGHSGLQVSVVGLGCNNFGMRIDQDATTAVVNQCFESGVNFFDTADVYGNRGLSEEFLGKALGDRRKDVIVATKFAMQMGDSPYMSGGSRRYIMSAVDASLRRLNTDYIDLYQMHRPDPKTPLEETIGALDDLVTAGKVRYVGHSNYAGWQTAAAHHISQAKNKTAFITAQNEYNLLKRDIETELVPACKAYNVSVLPFFPLASGFLTGKYVKGQAPAEGTRLAAWGARAQGVLSDSNFAVLEDLSSFAEARGKSMLDLAMGWLASLSYVGSVIAGATKPEQVSQNAAAGEWRLTPEEMTEVDGITKPKAR